MLAGAVSNARRASELGYSPLIESILSVVAGMATTIKLLQQPRDGLAGRPAKSAGFSGPDLLHKKLENLSLSQRVAKVL